MTTCVEGPSNRSETHRTREGDVRRGVGRAVAEWVLVIAIAAGLLSAYLSVVRDASTSDGTHTTRAVLVQPGDTLWRLAQDNPAPGHSTAQTVELIVALNELPGPSLTAGVSLEVPAPEQSHLAEVAQR